MIGSDQPDRGQIIIQEEFLSGETDIYNHHESRITRMWVTDDTDRWLDDLLDYADLDVCKIMDRILFRKKTDTR